MIALAPREDKKELIIENALIVFAEKGYYKATTAMVAKAAGVTQPYVFHFFENKEELFKVAIDRAFRRLYDRFSEVDSPADQMIQMMSGMFNEVKQTHRDEVLMLMQAHAIADAGIREHVRGLFLNIYESLALKFERAGIANAKERAAQFIGTGLLITVSEVLDLPQLVQGCGDECC